MKILIANKYNYPRGGGEIYTLGLEKLLKDNGHRVAVFSMQHPLNLRSEYSQFFPSEIDLTNLKPGNLLPVLIRPFGSYSVRKNFEGLLNDFKPDIIHLNNIHSQLSPVLAVIAKKTKIPVVWTLHDHKFLCPRYDCMRNSQPCELCFSDKFNVIRYKCMKNSLPASILAYAEAIVWNKNKLSRLSDKLLCPSNFLLKNLTKGGFDPKMLIVLPNFIDTLNLPEVQSKKSDYYCYVGRLSTEKGVETLIQAATELKMFKLKVIGTGPLEQKLKLICNRCTNIDYLGFQNWDDLKIIVKNSRFLVIPSECYENSPLSVIESLCLGTPVLGSRIGGIPELINESINGFTFSPGNKEDLKQQIGLMYIKSPEMDFIGIAKSARIRFSSEKYYKSLIGIYGNLLN